MKNRADIEVIAAILRSAKDTWQYQTTIMNKACISHSQVLRYISVAMNRGLIEYSKISGLYKTTKMGLEFLEKHAKLITLFPEIAQPSSQSSYY